jgi:hypothetical protein
MTTSVARGGTQERLTMNRTVLLAALALTALPVAAADRASSPAAVVAEDAFDWLEGEWVRETKRGTAHERWTRVSESTMEGVGGVTSGGETRIFEHLRLERFGDEVFYVAKPAENPYPTPFKLISVEHTGEGQSRFVFSNPDHDFPQRVVYVRDGEDGMLARIEGTTGGEDRAVDFRFRRAP